MIILLGSKQEWLTKIISWLTCKAKCEPVRHLRRKCNCLFSRGGGQRRKRDKRTRREQECNNKHKQPFRGETNELTARRIRHGPFVQFPSVESLTVPLMSPKNIFKSPLTTRGKGGTVFLGREDTESSVSCYRQQISHEAALLVI